MFWTKNKEGKKAGTTLIGITYGGCAALGTDFTPEKCQGDEIGVVKSCSGALVGFTGNCACEELVKTLIEKVKNSAEPASAAEEIAEHWETHPEMSNHDGRLVILNNKSAFLVSPGKSERVDSRIIAVGPGEEYALAAIRAVVAQPEVKETAAEIVKKAFDVAAGVCVLVNPGATIISLE